jgi:hypothetical protein
MKETRGSRVSETPQPWYPFPDSRHSSALETHAHRVSIVDTKGSASTESPLTTPSWLQRRRYRRILSAKNICKEANQPHPLTTTNPFEEQKRPDTKNKVPTRTEMARLQEESVRREEEEEIPDIEQWAAGDGFLYPQPAATPAPAKMLRSEDVRHVQKELAQIRKEKEIAQALKEKPIKTVYKTFDEEDFGVRCLTPTCLRRKSLLSFEFKAEDDKAAESGQPSPFYSQLRPDGTRSDSESKRQT